MKIVFMGTPEFAVPSLESIVKFGFEVTAVVTNPDEPQGRGLKVLPPPVKVAANELGLRVIQTASVKDPGFAGTIREISPDLIVVVAFRILPKEIFTIPRLGTFNLHASLLPRYRGAAPINWAIVNGERETGVTTFFLDEKVDTGKVILRKKTEIGEDETAGELSDRLSLLGAEAVVETLNFIKSGKVMLAEQDDSLATRAPKISKEDCLINWLRPVREVHNFIRGFSPDPGAFSFLNGKMIKIYRSKLTEAHAESHAGKVTVDGGKLFVSCADRLLEVVELQSEGKKRLSSQDFVRGARIMPDAKMESRRS